MAIWITGDTHGAEPEGSFMDGFMRRLNTSNFPEQKDMTKDDCVIICGDFGAIWLTDRRAFAEPASEKYALDWLESKPFTTLIVPGNHENYDRIFGIKDEKLLGSWLFAGMPEAEKQKFRAGYPQEQRFGGTVRAIRPSVLILEPGVFTVDGITIFAYGGAMSHDIRDGILDPSSYSNAKAFKAAYSRYDKEHKEFRVKGLSWWDQEQFDDAAEDAALKTLKEHDDKVDFIVTHTCAISDRTLICPSDTIARTEEFLQHIRYTVTYRHWFFGHMHVNVDLPGGKEHCLYEQIIRIA